MQRRCGTSSGLSRSSHHREDRGITVPVLLPWELALANIEDTEAANLSTLPALPSTNTTESYGFMVKLLILLEYVLHTTDR